MPTPFAKRHTSLNLSVSQFIKRLYLKAGFVRANKILIEIKDHRNFRAGRDLQGSFNPQPPFHR